MATSNNPSTAEITQLVDYDPAKADRISHRAVPQQPPMIQEPDPAWPSAFAGLESRIRRALGDTALHVNHVGSTSVPGLAAKPVIDVDVVVADAEDEAAYVGRLVGEGWDAPEARGTGMGWPEGERDASAGLQFILREPAWFQHRFFVCVDPVANVHVFGPGCPEVVRHRMFRDWLIEKTVCRLGFSLVTSELGNDETTRLGFLLLYEPWLTICAHLPRWDKQHPEDRDRYAAVKHEAAAASREAGETMQDYTLRKDFVIREILDRAFKAEGLLQ